MKILALIGLSGCGKTLISDILQRNYPDFLSNEIIKDLERIPRFSRYTTSTSRKPRENEQNGIDYYFYSKEVFEDKIKNNDFYEYAKVYDNYYGLSKEEVESKSKELNPIVLIMDPQGIETIRQSQEVIRVYVDISLKTMQERLKKRGESEETLKIRMRKLNYFLEYRNQCEYVIDGNKDINLVIYDLIKIIKQLK